MIIFVNNQKSKQNFTNDVRVFQDVYDLMIIKQRWPPVFQNLSLIDSSSKNLSQIFTSKTSFKLN